MGTAGTADAAQEFLRALRCLSSQQAKTELDGSSYARACGARKGLFSLGLSARLRSPRFPFGKLRVISGKAFKSCPDTCFASPSARDIVNQIPPLSQTGAKGWNRKRRLCFGIPAPESAKETSPGADRGPRQARCWLAGVGKPWVTFADDKREPRRRRH
jgi:hypothetical protein